MVAGGAQPSCTPGDLDKLKLGDADAQVGVDIGSPRLEYPIARSPTTPARTARSSSTSPRMKVGFAMMPQG